MTGDSQAVKGGALMATAMLAFILTDTLTKVALSDMDVGQFLVTRGVFASGMILAIIAMGGRLRQLRRMTQPAVALRSAFDLAATLLFVSALAHLPLPNLTAVMQSVPLIVTLLAALLLREPVGWRRLSAIAAGFAGVLMIVKPGGEGFNQFVVLALACAFVVAGRDLVTRRIPPDVPSIVVAFANASIVTLGGAGLALSQDWVAYDARQLALAAGAGGFVVCGYLTTVMALRTTDIVYTAPFRYTIIVWALILGYLVFGDVPDSWALIGTVLVVGSGLYTLYRERRLQRRVGFDKRPVR